MPLTDLIILPRREDRYGGLARPCRERGKDCPGRIGARGGHAGTGNVLSIRRKELVFGAIITGTISNLPVLRGPIQETL